MIDSGLSWSFQQSHYWNGVLEVVLLCIGLFAILYFPSSFFLKSILSAILLLSFSYLHSYLYAFIVGILYAFMIWMTGKLVFRALKKEAEFLGCILMGMAGLIALVGICSLLKIGTPSKLRVVYLVLFLLELFIFRNTLFSWIKAFFAKYPLSSKSSVSFSKSLMLAVAVSALMIQVGRANIAIDYDSGWYGLRSVNVLAPYTGIFDQLMLTGCVYVYSKGIEVLSLAFSSAETFSYVYAVNLMFGAFILIAAYQITSLFCKKEIAYYAVICCAVTAGIMNMTSTTKPDVSTLFIQLVAFYYGAKAVKNRCGKDYMLAIAAFVLSLGFKPTSVIFSTILIVLITLFSIKRVKLSASDLLLLVLPGIAVVMLLARTYVLTGLPLTLFADKLWAVLGMAYKYPYNASVYSNIMPLSELFQAPVFFERLIRIVHFLFWPVTVDMDHIIIAWPGVLFSIVWIAIVVHVFSHPVKTFQRMKENVIYAFSVTTLALISGLSMACVLILNKPDGNYFMLMYALTFIHAGFEFDFLSKKEGSLAIAAQIPLIICGVLMCVASHWSWQLGFTPIDLENKGAYNHKAVYEQYYQDIQIDALTNHIETSGSEPARILIFSSDIPKILFIDAIAESWIDIEHWGNNSIAQSAEALYSYFCAAEMDYLLVNMDYAQGDALISANLQGLADMGCLELVQTQGNHCLLRFAP